MYDHVGIRTGNLDASVRFYTAVLAPLGYLLCSRDASGAGFGPKGEPALWLHLHKGPAATGAHIAFRAPDPDELLGANTIAEMMALDASLRLSKAQQLMASGVTIWAAITKSPSFSRSSSSSTTPILPARMSAIASSIESNPPAGPSNAANGGSTAIKRWSVR